MTRLGNVLIQAPGGPDIVIVNEDELTEIVITGDKLWAAADALAYFAQALTGARPTPTAGLLLDQAASPGSFDLLAPDHSDSRLYDDHADGIGFRDSDGLHEEMTEDPFAAGTVSVDRLLQVANGMYRSIDRDDEEDAVDVLTDLIARASWPDQLWDTPEFDLYAGQIGARITGDLGPDEAPVITTADGRPVDVAAMAAHRDAMMDAGMASNYAQRLAVLAAAGTDPCDFEAFQVTSIDPQGHRQIVAHFTDAVGDSVIFTIPVRA